MTMYMKADTPNIIITVTTPVEDLPNIPITPSAEDPSGIIPNIIITPLVEDDITQNNEISTDSQPSNTDLSNRDECTNIIIIETCPVGSITTCVDELPISTDTSHAKEDSQTKNQPAVDENKTKDTQLQISTDNSNTKVETGAVCTSARKLLSILVSVIGIGIVISVALFLTYQDSDTKG